MKTCYLCGKPEGFIRINKRKASKTTYRNFCNECYGRVRVLNNNSNLTLWKSIQSLFTLEDFKIKREYWAYTKPNKKSVKTIRVRKK